MATMPVETVGKRRPGVGWMVGLGVLIGLNALAVFGQLYLAAFFAWASEANVADRDQYLDRAAGRFYVACGLAIVELGLLVLFVKWWRRRANHIG